MRGRDGDRRGGNDDGYASLSPGIRFVPGGGKRLGCGTGIDVAGNTLGCGTGMVVGGVCCAILEDEAGADGVTLGDVGVGDEEGTVRREKISLRVLMAWNWASPGLWKGAFGWGLAMASARVMAARCASSAGEDDGIAQLWGKNSTVILSLSPRVAGI